MAFESFITVQTPAADLNLLTIEQLRAAAGVSDGSKDTALKALGARVSSAITAACRVADDGINPPTLRKETILETFRRPSYWAKGSWPFADSEMQRHSLILARRPAVSVASVIVDGTTLDATQYELHAADGILVRLSGDQPTAWLNWKIIVTYDAGFATVRDDLALVASQLAQILWWQDGRDPNQKVDYVDGVGRSEWFANPHLGDLVPASLIGALDAAGYVNHIPG
ncbi:hypothetical protein [Methylosinus sp. LW4]|uniref:hypothetical protein n=1 Tax=Methylosinus sp. LW4 TaxID=136993 RepID=UPI00036CCD2D|nr:hypothetical protein [Methylosinus sp. LW4]